MEENIKIENATTNETIPEYKAIFKFGIAKKLLEEYGHRLVGMKMNRDNSGNIVFFFENTLQLHYDMQRIIRDRRRRVEESDRKDEIEKPEQED